MEDALSTQISDVHKKEGVHLVALPAIPVCYGKRDGHGCFLARERELQHGLQGHIFRFVHCRSVYFASKDEDFVPAAKESELATMRFVRESGLYPTIPVPRGHLWDLTFTNPLGAAYVFMGVVEGVTLDKISTRVGDWKLCGSAALELKCSSQW